MAEVAEMAEKRVLKDNLCHLRHLCQCKFLCLQGVIKKVHDHIDHIDRFGGETVKTVRTVRTKNVRETMRL